MLSTLKNAWTTEQTRKRIIFTILMLFVLRLGNALPIPFANLQLINQIYNSVQGSLLGIMNSIGVMSNGRLSGIVNTDETNQEELLRLSTKYL